MIHNKTFNASTSDVSLSTSWSAATAVTLRGALKSTSSIYYKQGEITAINVKLKSISGCASLTVRVAADSAGDYPIVPDTTATIQVGKTTATLGSVVIHGSDFRSCFPVDSDGKIYIFIKTDAGTATADHIVLTWSE